MTDPNHDVSGRLARRHSVVMAWLLFMPLFFAGIQTEAGGSPGKPNILILLGDDMTYTDLGCFGNDDVRTPHLDRLAGQGMRLLRCFSPAPMCAPVRMSLYTGLYPVRNGAHPNHSYVREGVRSLPQYLKPLGYRVAILGKRHYKPKEAFPFEFLGGRHHDGGKGVDLDLSKMRSYLERDTEKPFCLVIASNQPHRPWNRGDAAPYDADTLELPPYLVDTPKTREAMTRYYAEITYLDNQVGKALRILEETGNAESTLVLFFSEQGSNFPHCKWTCYETGLRAAGIARFPQRVTPKSETKAMIQYVDVVPTLLEIAGGDPGKHDLDGRSFLDVLKGKDDDHRDFVFGIQTSKGIIKGPRGYGIRSVRGKRFKYILNLFPDTRFQNLVTARDPVFASWRKAAEAGNKFARKRTKRYQKRPAVELYDLKKDPFELNNLAGDPSFKEQKTRLRSELDEWMQQQGDKGRATELNALDRQSHQ